MEHMEIMESTMRRMSVAEAIGRPAQRPGDDHPTKSDLASIH
jgi:hypothetical protein